MSQTPSKDAALWVLKRLRDAGHQALLAGGCVRDMLLERPSSDYDLATDATPDQVKALFRRVLLVGAKFGVAMVLHRGQKIEVTTFRSESSYSDGRRPDSVRFTTAREDALRRDFTINGMFFDPVAQEIIDYVGGREDLRRGIIRTIGSPQQRFEEDYLRMLRAPRFAVRFGFGIDPPTADAIRASAQRITRMSGERIFDELSRMFGAPSAAQAAGLLAELGLAQVVLPELFASTDLWPTAMARLEALAKHQDLALSLGSLLCDVDADAIAPMVRRWGASNRLRDALVCLSSNRDEWRIAADPEAMPLARLKRLLHGRHFGQLRALWEVRERLQTGQTLCAEALRARVDSIDPASIWPDPLANGEQLQKYLHLPEGPQLGALVKALYDAQLNERIHTLKEAIEMARELWHAQRPR
jgi:tRNA nucleotidyltransferase/poly(A) polymerase